MASSGIVTATRIKATIPGPGRPGRARLSRLNEAILSSSTGARRGSRITTPDSTPRSKQYNYKFLGDRAMLARSTRSSSPEASVDGRPEEWVPAGKIGNIVISTWWKQPRAGYERLARLLVANRHVHGLRGHVRPRTWIPTIARVSFQKWHVPADPSRPAGSRCEDGHLPVSARLCGVGSSTLTSRLGSNRMLPAERVHSRARVLVHQHGGGRSGLFHA